jgi:nucleoside-diphosphate-sugar epimerase
MTAANASASDRASVLVTGATGFLGRHLADELRRRGIAFAAMARSAEKARGYLEQGIEVSWGDVRDAAACAEAVRGRQVVVHLAAAADVSSPAVNQSVNIDGLRTILRASRESGVGRFLFVSSTCAGRKLRDAYGETKLQGETLVKESGLVFTILRPTMIYGRGSKEFGTFVRVIQRSRVVPLIGPGRNLVQPVLIDDAVGAMLALMHAPVASGRTYDLAGATPISFDDFVRLVCATLGLRRRILLHLPVGPMLVSARALGWVATHVPLTVDQVLAFVQDTVVDLEPLRRDIGFAPRTLAEGLALVLRPVVSA